MQIRVSRVDIFSEINIRAYPFIRNVKVGRFECQAKLIGNKDITPKTALNTNVKQESN